MKELTELQKQTLRVAQLSMDELPKTHLQLCQMIWGAYEAGEKVGRLEIKSACDKQKEICADTAKVFMPSHPALHLTRNINRQAILDSPYPEGVE